MRFPLDRIADVIGADNPGVAATIGGWSIDSRTVEAGDLFFALRGGNHDGHAFVSDAARKGAVAAVVDRSYDEGGALPLLRTADTLRALQTLAANARREWGRNVVAVTGSGGKTTTKELIAAFLATAMPVGKTVGNFNNHVGLPLSILRLPEEARAAVLEIGMNHPGEIRELAAIAQPSVGVVTNVGHVHMEFFASIDEVALAKRELVEALPPDGAAVLNADDPLVSRFREVYAGRVVTFGFSPEADVRAEECELQSGGLRLRIGRDAWLESPLLGRHGAYNLLAAVAVARVFGIPPGSLVEAARSVEPGRMRGRRFTHAGITVFDDCYNSNPEAVRLMLDVLRIVPARRRIAVLGEMRELGRWSESLHRDVGSYAASCGIHVLIGIRGAARYTVDEAVKSGLSDSAAFFCEGPEEAGERARELAREGDAILFKGSRGTAVERALETFLS